MPRNTIKGKNDRPGSNKATGRDYSYDKKYQKRKSRVKYRVELNKANRRAGTYGNKDGKDASHTTKGTIVMENMHANRKRNRGKKKC